MAGKVESNDMPGRYLGFWTIVIFISFLMIIPAGCTNPQPGKGFAGTISPEQKKAELKKKLSRRYEDSQTHFLLGQLYHADRAWDDAEFYYNNALRFDPVYRPAQAGMIKLCVDKGDTLKAQNYLDIYMNHAGESPDQLIDLAAELQKQNVDKYALICFNKALAIAPKSAKVNKAVAYYYLNRNEKDKAREYFENSFNIDRNQPDVSRELGKLNVPIVYESKPPKTEGTEK